MIEWGCWEWRGGVGGGVGPDITFVLLSEPMGKIWENALHHFEYVCKLHICDIEKKFIF